MTDEAPDEGMRGACASHKPLKLCKGRAQQLGGSDDPSEHKVRKAVALQLHVQCHHR